MIAGAGLGTAGVDERLDDPDHSRAVGSPVAEVPDEYESALVLVSSDRVVAELLEQCLERLPHFVNVADDIERPVAKVPSL